MLGDDFLGPCQLSPKNPTSFRKLAKFLISCIKAPMLLIAKVYLIVTCVIIALGYRVDEIEVLKEDLALAELNRLKFDEPFRIMENSPSSNFMIGDVPLLHHLFNLFMLAKSPIEKKLSIELLYLGISKGLDVKMSHNTHYEPDLLYKSIFIRNMTISQAILKQLVDNPYKAITNVDSQHLLSLLSCDTVPLAKMLLHGSNVILQSKLLESEKNIEADVNDLIKLLSEAVLSEKGSKFAYNGLELSRFSKSYKAVLTALVTKYSNT